MDDTGNRTLIEGVRHSTRGAKMGTSHIVPLSRQAVELMRHANELTGGFELVFRAITVSGVP